MLMDMLYDKGAIANLCRKNNTFPPNCAGVAINQKGKVQTESPTYFLMLKKNRRKSYEIKQKITYRRVMEIVRRQDTYYTSLDIH